MAGGTWWAKAYPNQHVIVVDAGTATTVDFVTSDNHHLGGWIVPGLDLMTSSIAQRAVKVFDDDNTTFNHGFGQTTPAALKSGCLAAQLGLIHQAVSMFDREAVLILAGGSAPLLLEHIQALNPVHDPMIVFKGLDRF